MPDRDEERYGPFMLSVFAASRVCDLRDSAAEVTAVIKAIRAPKPTLPLDPVASERVLAKALLEKDKAANRLLAWVEAGL